MVIEAGIGAGAAIAGTEIVKTIEERDSIPTRLLTEIRDQLVIQNRYAARDRQRSLYPFDVSSNAAGVGRRFAVDTKMRASHLLIFPAGAAGTVMTFRMGTAALFTFVVTASQTPMEITLPMVLTAGTEIFLTASAGTWTAYLWAELDRDDISRQY